MGQEQVKEVSTQTYNQKIDIAKAIDLRLKGLTLEEIGKQFNCTKSAVGQILTKYLGDEDIDVQAFKDRRADMLAGKQAQLLLSLTQDEIKRMPPGSRPTAFGIFFDKERLERGEATAHIAYMDYGKRLDELDAEEQELLKERDKLL